MCGIGGVIHHSGVQYSYLETLQEGIKHRGPDGNGILQFPQAGLVHTRLAIIDKEGGHQLISSPDGRWHLTYNGEIYNFRSLREELIPYWDFHTRCDTEVLLAAWCVWGEEALTKLNGMFAFCIWDNVQKTGVLVRDRLGVKPLAYLQQDNGLFFASEAKALLPFVTQRKADEEKLKVEVL